MTDWFYQTSQYVTKTWSFNTIVIRAQRRSRIQVSRVFVFFDWSAWFIFYASQYTLKGIRLWKCPNIMIPKRFLDKSPRRNNAVRLQFKLGFRENLNFEEIMPNQNDWLKKQANASVRMWQLILNEATLHFYHLRQIIDYDPWIGLNFPSTAQI